MLSMKILVLGDKGVGKSSLIKSYIGGDKFELNKDEPSTIGVDFVLGPESDEGARGQFWELGGDDRFRSIMSPIVRGTHGAIIAFDSTNRATFESIPIWMDLLDQHAKGVPVYFIATKSFENTESHVSVEEGRALAETYLGEYYQTNARDTRGVAETFTKILSSLMHYRKSTM
eukprot:TRINITY_DN6385_c0_g1_i1.p1 TRINITY_DN6385_c0_g1~~TRINITY_DN6385_c0_g1_i1.p1  ORF type:complete len:173 (+),score=22.29 TRINITY_DN6385_c0_g1_i1:52-570(+)